MRTRIVNELHGESATARGAGYRPARRRLLRRLAGALAAGALPPAAQATDESEVAPYPAVVRGHEIRFPRDHGAHPRFRTEWWYLTAVLEVEGEIIGLQLTFFRTRTPHARDNPSRFAPTQLVLAHVAISDPAHGRLRHDEQSFRADPPVASAAEGDTDVAVGLPVRRWRFRRDTDDRYHASIEGERFSYAFVATPSAHFPDPVLQGDAGFSRKGPRAEQASYYYSRPQLAMEGRLVVDGDERPFRGRGWLDHEWSSEILPENASGWDWMGLNLADGGAIMAFRMRRRDGGVLHSTFRHFRSRREGGGYADYPVTFEVVREWTSPRTGASYPVAQRVVAGPFDYVLEPLQDDQELDGTRSTGAIYYEGVVRMFASDASRRGPASPAEAIGQGFLELSGYAGDLTL